MISPKEINEKACLLFLNRIPLNTLRLYVTQFLDSSLENAINQKICSCLAESQQKGCCAVILSSSPDFLVSEISKRLGVELWGATEYNVDASGVISGVKIHMDGIEKAAYVNRICQRYAISPKETTVYSDSFFDLPFLQAAGTAIAVNPDKKLRQYSLANNWKII